MLSLGADKLPMISDIQLYKRVLFILTPRKTEDKTTQLQLSPVVAERSLVILYPRTHPADGGSAA